LLNKEKLVKNPNWLEADQLAIHKAWRITDKKSIEWQGGGSEPRASGLQNRTLHLCFDSRYELCQKKRGMKKRERKVERKKKETAHKLYMY